MLLAAEWQMIGSLADWATTVVAVIAGVVAYRAFRETSKTNNAQQETLELQRKQYEDAQKQLRRSQAEKVSFWSVTDTMYPRMRLEPPPVLVTSVINASESPIFLVDLVLTAPDNQRSILASVNAIPPGIEPMTFELPQFVSELHFQDATGLYWVRHSNGDLVRLTLEERNEYRNAVRADFILDLMQVNSIGAIRKPEPWKTGEQENQPEA